MDVMILHDYYLQTAEEEKSSPATLEERESLSWIFLGRLAKDLPLVAVSITARRAYIKRMFRTESHIYLRLRIVKPVLLWSLVRNSIFNILGSPTALQLELLPW